jgi:alpha-1,6-mannosyltransferase
MSPTVPAAPDAPAPPDRPAARARLGAAGPWLALAAGVVLYAGVLAGLLTGAWGLALWSAVLGGAAVMGAGLALARDAPPRTGLVVLVAGAIVFRALLFVAPAASASDDIYRFLWDGRVQGAQINPFRYAPDDPELAALHDEAVWPNINRSGVRTIYPPAAQGVFYAAWAARLHSPHAFKLLVVGADLAALAVLLVLLRRERRPQRWALAYAWNPVVLLGFAHAGHYESLVVLALLTAVWAWRSGRLGWAGVAVGVAASLKLYPLLVLPAFLRHPDGVWRWRTAVAVAVAAVGVLAVGYLPYLPGVGPDGVAGYLPGYLDEEGFTSGRRFLVVRDLGLDGRLVAPLAGAVIALLVLRSRAHAATRAAWLLGAAIVLTTPPYSWYVTPVLALALVGGAGWVWPWVAVAFEASYVAIFHRPSDLALSVPIKQVAAGLLVLVALMAVRFGWARRAVVRQPPPEEAEPGPGKRSELARP